VSVLLPPSETKAEGGTGAFALGRLSFRSLTPYRRTVVDAVVALSLDPVEAARVLKLGPKGADVQVDRNRRLRRAPVLPAVERYTGVVYEGLSPRTLEPDARAWVDAHVVIASALLGIVGAADGIPAYRLSASTPLPGIPLPRHWGAPVAAVLTRSRDWILDARSGGYAALGPAPASASALLVETPDGRALNHFNKLHKGRLVRAIAESAPELGSRDDLLAWGREAGIDLRARGERDVVLVVDQDAAVRNVQGQVKAQIPAPVPH
jgi:cytoplasmic iron level regulating protein YaaA (DUF328/UPF0246 family)